MSRARRFVPSFDALESREVPAGNVTATVLNGNLIVTGDAQANEIEIRNDNGNIRLQGVAGGTTVNGVAFETFGGVFKDVIINLKGGNDLVHLDSSAVISRDLLFTGGGGTDSLTSESGADIGRDLIFNGGGQQSNATLDDIVVGRHARISGNGNVSVQAVNGIRINGLLEVTSPAIAGLTVDNAILGRVKVTGNQVGVGVADAFVGGNVKIQGGAGVDLIGLAGGNEILGNLTILTGDGNDGAQVNGEIGGNVNVQLGKGSNQAFFTSDLTVFGNLTVVSEGNATDNWTLDGVDVFGRTRLESGGGADTLLFNDALFLGATTLLTGNGADQVQLSDGNNVSFGGTTLIDLGKGADTLQLGAGGIGQAGFSTTVTLNGGAGDDTLNDINSDFGPPPIILSF